jgi:glycosyltransferase involved in cell wall biosynthesis
MCYETSVTSPAPPSARNPTVAIDVTPLLGARSGIGATVAEIVTALGAMQAGPQLVPYTLSWRARNHKADVPGDTQFIPIPARVLLRAWARGNTPRVDRWLRRSQVVHATNYLAPPSRLPTLVSVYDCSFVRYPELCTREVRAFEPIVRHSIARGATVHTGSEFVANEIEDAFGAGLRAAGRIVVIPLGIPSLGDASALSPALAETLDHRPFVLAIGTLEPRKNLPHLVGAFGVLADAHPDLHLVLAGHDGPARPAVDDAIARLAGASRARVIVTGSVDDAGKRALLERASVLAYPSIYEGFGFPVLEAMALGVPVVAARAGSIPEVAGDAALLIEPTDETALAGALEQALSDDATRAQLIARGHDQVRSFSWEDTARALASCYRGLATQ